MYIPINIALRLLLVNLWLVFWVRKRPRQKAPFITWQKQIDNRWHPEGPLQLCQWQPLQRRKPPSLAEFFKKASAGQCLGVFVWCLPGTMTVEIERNLQTSFPLWVWFPLLLRAIPCMFVVFDWSSWREPNRRPYRLSRLSIAAYSSLGHLWEKMGHSLSFSSFAPYKY